MIGDSALRGNEIDEGAKRHDRNPLEAEPLEIALDEFAKEIRAAVEDRTALVVASMGPRDRQRSGL